MRTVLWFAIATVAAIGGVIVLTNREPAPSSGYRVDVVFDTAKGLLPGQLVKVAGARSGEIVDVRLTGDHKARVQLRVDPAFGPFTRDARCTIQPEGLIGENFVQCDPGRRDRPALRGRGGLPPTVPVERTTVPVSFPELFDLATIPVRKRLSVVVAGLGLGLAGRGEDLNAVIARADPTLGLVRELGAILDRQRAQLGQAVRTTDAVLASLAPKRERAGALVSSASRVTGRIAGRRTALRAALRRLPALLRGTDSTVARLDEVLRDGTPVLEDLREAAPGVRQVVDELPPFSRAALPALDDVGRVSVTGRATARRAASTVRRLRRFTEPALPAGRALEALLTDARDRGVIEMLLEGFRHNAAATARYDERSHLLPLRTTLSTCSVLATTPTAGCDAHYRPQQGSTRRERVPRRRAGSTRPSRRERQNDPSPATAPPAQASPAPPKRKPPVLPDVPDTGIDAVDKLVDGLLSAGRATPDPHDTGVVEGLLDYLLG